MTTIRDLVLTLATTDPTHPRLTWYGTANERVELSGRVLTNTVVKATNLLVEEADAEPGTRVALDLPVHWRTLAWALASWTAGAEVMPGRAPAPAGATSAGPAPDADAPGRTEPDRTLWDVLVSDRPPASYPADTTGPAVVVGIALPALAMRYPGTLPPGAIDGAAGLMTYPDNLGPLAPVDPGSAALGAVTASPRSRTATCPGGPGPPRSATGGRRRPGPSSPGTT